MPLPINTIPDENNDSARDVHRASWGTVFGAGIARVLDFVLPHICLSCKQPMVVGQNICPACWPNLQFITAPQCHCCGTPFGFEMGDGTLCAACIEYTPDFTMARAALRYDDYSKPLILGFKHADKTHLRLWLGKILAQSARAVTDGADYIVPVPLHWTRLLKRRYNQSALLAAELSIHCGVPHADDLLARIRRTTPHENMDRGQRERNVKRAFAVRDHYAEKIIGKTIVLVDDVFTTGSTVAECSRTLLRAGAGAVRVATVARVCKGL